ncbi:hypothetical protein HK100_000196 [Physocladia obscura]|uniref:Uncharacterized protein n=1 Tax=Physocladia obscura TaxID=109957 RepID=A0AAD5T070_9FUNG|nr:hypothetical protein HK100_000196 [Physocladia obscura]
MDYDYSDIDEDDTFHAETTTSVKPPTKSIESQPSPTQPHEEVRLFASNAINFAVPKIVSAEDTTDDEGLDDHQKQHQKNLSASPEKTLDYESPLLSQETSELDIDMAEIDEDIRAIASFLEDDVDLLK